ncbi:MAG: carboxypeptidase regulatory-like domain-containing protein [Deltaproteobacteria bacterium]|nr:carboxypeptidase regulatory-like domain-containing protein [Deltaproteobacteria bacterium]
MTRTRAIYLALTTLAACSFTTPEEDRIRNVCSSDSDCGVEGRCSAGMCISTRTATLMFEVVPPATADVALPQPIGAAATTGFDNLELTIAAPVDIFGTIRAPSLGGDYALAVPARITATMLDGIPGVPASVNTAALAAPVAPSQSLDGLDMSYRVRVVPSHAYLLTFDPTEDEDDTRLPPMQQIVEVGATSVRVDIEYPAELREVPLRVVDHEGNPERDLGVRALAGIGGARVSTIGVTDREGRVRLLMAPNASDLPVIAVGPTLPGALMPSFVIPTLGLELEADGTRRLRLPPPSGSVCYSGTVVGMARNGTIAPVAGASLTFTNTAMGDSPRGLIGTLRVSATTDADGAFEVQLAPSPTAYEVAVVPAAEGDSGVLVTHTTITQRPAGVRCVMGQELSLPLRVALGGRVMSPDGRAISNATLEAVPRRPLIESPDAVAERLARTTTTASGADGGYRMLLDPGTYDLLVRAPPDSGFPWSIVRGLEVRASTATQDVHLPAPVPVSGFVRDPSAAGVGGATVNVYSLDQQPDAAPRTWLVASTRTEADGRYRLLAPSTLARD